LGGAGGDISCRALVALPPPPHTTINQPSLPPLLNRKVQLKPLRWSSSPDAAAADAGRPSAAPSLSQPLSAQSSLGTTTVSVAAGLSVGATTSSTAEPSVGGQSPTAAAAATAGGGGTDALLPATQLLQTQSSGGSGAAAAATAATTAAGSAGGAAADGQAPLQPSSLLATAAAAAGGTAAKPEVEELLLILKWGGVLTHAGRRQAEDLGRTFRLVMYPRWVGQRVVCAALLRSALRCSRLCRHHPTNSTKPTATNPPPTTPYILN
jgi:hypothetical protein